jgi:hypothetical protein
LKFFPIMANKDKHSADYQAQQIIASKWREDIEQNYTYCMISTLNQMVNYLPMLLFNFQQTKMYLTLEKSRQNEPYDQYLFETCKSLENSTEDNRFSMPDIKIEIGNVNNIQLVQKTLSDEAKGKKILWNITGGQRPFIMAIFELLKEEERKDDLVMYLEGNAGELVFLEVGKDKTLKEISQNTHGFESYAVNTKEQKPWLNISIALQLMGFGTKTLTKDPVNEPEHIIYQLAIQKYKTQERFRKKLLALNKMEDQPENGITYRTKKILEEEANKAEYFCELTSEELQLLVNHKDQTYPFGHFLEKLYAHAIYDIANEGIAEIATNVRLRYADEQVHTEAGGKHIDELDIAVLTKTGQLVVFEVKSGAMSGDVAKSTKYTTYAVAGVYGKPILLSALLTSQLNDLENLRKHWAYGSSASAVAAARRAQLPVLSLDGNQDGDFNQAIEKILQLS